MASLKNKIQASNEYKVNEVVQSLTATKDEETTEYALATDSNHVTMSTGYNLEESFNALANTMSEEFVSEDGSEITVENCIDKTRILEVGISGYTGVLKRAKDTDEEWVEVLADEERDTETYDYKLDSTQATLNVNGIKHSFYVENGEVIELHKVEGVCDSLVQKVDGSLELTRRIDTTSEEYTVLATPITTHIDKKYNSAIPITSGENTISVGDGVQASEFSVKVASNKISKLEQQVEALQNVVLLLNNK